MAIILLPFISTQFSCVLNAQDTTKIADNPLLFTGQASVWSNINKNSSLPFQLGGKYIPTLNYGIHPTPKKLIDFEVAGNIYGAISFHPFDSSESDGKINAYRAWARFSTSQLEVRLGLQKINFGSATLLRPLMWFDQMDPRDPLQITNGIWGLLGRYYFLNNANAWLWCLYGNEKLRPWDIGYTNKNIPEIGGRFQHPIPKGEIAVTYHYRNTDMNNFGYTDPAFAEIPESKIGLDGKWDLGIGFWFEGVWINKSKNVGPYTNQEIMNIGFDNTFALGNGLHVSYEQLIYAADKNAFNFNNPYIFSGLSLGYPVGIVDNLSAILYYDWKNNKSYNFINWRHDFNKISFYAMAYINPDIYNLPQQGDTGNFYGGPGFQLMLVYHH